MKRFFKLILVLTFIIPFITNIHAQEAFVINHYDIKIDVQEDGKILVKEKIAVTFSQQRHGIYSNISTKYNVNIDNINKTYTFPITNAKVLSNHQYDVETQNNGISFKIGSKDSYANTNEVYELSYVINTNNLNFEDYSLFYQNLIYRWDTTVDQFTFEINFPKDINKDKVAFYIGNDINNNNYLKYTVDQKTIKGVYDHTLKNNESITLSAILDKNYYTYPTYTTYYTIFSLISGLGLVIAILLYLKHKKNATILTTTVMFQPPKGVSSAECGFIIDNQANNHDIISLILEWSKDGYLKIKEIEDGLQFTKIKELDDQPEYQKKLFMQLFYEGDVVSTITLKDKFYQHINSCINNLTFYMNRKENRVYDEKSQAIVILFSIIAIMLSFGYAFMNNYFKNLMIINGMFSIVIQNVPLIVLMLLLLVYKDKKYALTKINKSGYAILSIILSVIYIVLGILYSETKYLPFTIIINLCCLIMLFIAPKYLEFSGNGAKRLGEILGLKQFIEYAEKDRLEALVKDNPYYFFDILPYAYAFQMVDVWNEHFKDLETIAPDWYEGQNTFINNYILISALNNSLYHASHDMTSIPVTASNDVGGGFGSGGGGFSGGGFGGSSGGSW
ncbi:MAG: DUF2207 domain-containing protein [Erysipelotrichaceae bacterium]